MYHTPVSLRGGPETVVKEILSVFKTVSHTVYCLPCGGDSGLIHEYTLSPEPEGTIEDQREGSLEKLQVDGTMEVGLEYANIYVSH